jgi:3-oxoacyl-[acyl-carrier protein] reductase
MSTENILITGASSDLGMDLVRSIAESGVDCRVLAHFHNGRERINQLQAILKGRIVPVEADLTCDSGVEQLIEQAHAAMEFPQKIVHLAGLKLRLERFHQAKMARFDADFCIHVRAAMRLLQEFLPAMARAPHRAKIVLVLSSVTIGPPPKFMAMYTVIKHAELGLLRALAADYAGGSVDINGVSPSMVETQFLSEIPEKAKELAAAAMPQGRLAAARDVVKVIEFLLSPASNYLNGVNIPVTGGTVF